MGIIFDDDDVVRCDACGSEIELGDTYQIYVHKNKIYHTCSYEECKSALLFRLYGDDFDMRKRLTKHDYIEMWARVEGG